MKKYVFILIMAVCTITASAQKLNEPQVPVPAKQAFQKEYPGTKAGWEKEKANYEVNFKKEGKTMSAVIDSKGNIMETETGIAITALPLSVRNYVKDHYKGAAIKEAARIVKAGGEVNYEAEVKGMDVLFDGNGNFIKEAKD